MADYVPSAIVVGGAIVTIGILYIIRAPLFLILVVAVLSLFLVFSQHRNLFIGEYRNAQILDMFSGYASFIIIGVIILISLFYIFFLRGLVSPRVNSVTAVPNNTSKASNFLPSTVPPYRANTNTNTNTTFSSLNLNRGNNRNRANLLAALERAV